jgi:hypothetical protein
MLCMFAFAQLWSEFLSRVVCGTNASVRETSLCSSRFYRNSGARNNSTRRTASYTVATVSIHSKHSYSDHNLCKTLIHLSTMDDKEDYEVAHDQRKIHVNGHEYDPDDPEDDVYADDAFLTSKADST